jgi:hypothetical protein
MNKNLAHFAHHFFSMQGSLPIGLKILVTPLVVSNFKLEVSIQFSLQDFIKSFHPMALTRMLTLPISPHLQRGKKRYSNARKKISEYGGV